MKQNKKEKLNYKECSDCLQIKEARQLNIRHQDFEKTYKSRWSSEKGRRKGYWIYNTENYSLCKNCMNNFLKRIRKQK